MSIRSGRRSDPSINTNFTSFGPLRYSIDSTALSAINGAADVSEANTPFHTNSNHGNNAHFFPASPYRPLASHEITIVEEDEERHPLTADVYL